MEQAQVRAAFYAAIEKQSEYWDALRELETALGCDLDAIDVTGDDLCSMSHQALMKMASEVKHG